MSRTSSGYRRAVGIDAFLPPDSEPIRKRSAEHRWHLARDFRSKPNERSRQLARHFELQCPASVRRRFLAVVHACL